MFDGLQNKTASICLIRKKKEEEVQTDINNSTENLSNEIVADENQGAETEKAEEQIIEQSAEEKLKAELAELNDKYLRLFAEFDNFKRRTQKERVELLQTAGKDVLVALLPILDDFERALAATAESVEVAPVREGIQLIHNKLKSTLNQRGLAEIESVNQVFDTDLHEAITQIPAPSDEMKGKVIDEVQKGYKLNDKVIRYAKVVVGA